MKYYRLLFLGLAACGQSPPERAASTAKVLATHSAVTATKPTTVPYTSGDQATNGLHDTLHVGRDIVLQLKPGSRQDFLALPMLPKPFSEARLIRREGNGKVYRQSRTLIFKPFAGSILRFVDNDYKTRGDDNEAEYVHYSFLGSIPSRPYWIADSIMHEYYHPFLINKKSGQITSLWWDPKISPNRQFLFVATPGLDIESSINGLQLFTISNQNIRPLWTRVLVNWQPQEVRWLNNYTIAIKQMRFEPKESFTYVRLILPH